MKRVTQVLYSGLGGHGSVAFSILEGDKYKLTDQSFVFYGIETLKEEYKIICENKKIKYASVLLTNHFIGSIKSLYYILKQKPQAVILHSNSLFTIVPILRLFGINVISVDHTPNTTKTKKEWIAIKLLRFLANSQVYLTKEQFEDYELRFGNKFHKYTVSEIINNGLDTERFSPANDKINSGILRIMMQARFSYTKDFQTLIRSVALLKDKIAQPFHVYLAGSGDTWEECTQICKNLGLDQNITFLGMLSEDVLIEELRKTDLYVHSSLSETMSTAIMQALSIGLPCLVSDIPGNRSIIKEGENGWLFKTKDELDLANRMKEILLDESSRLEMSLKARKFALDHLSMEAMFEKYYQLIK